MKNSILIILILLSHVVTSQNSTDLSTFESSYFNNQIKTEGVLSILSTELEKSIVIRNKGRYIVFDIFDKNLEREKSKIIKLASKETYIGSLYLNGKIKIFLVQYPRPDTKVIACIIYNIESNTIEKKEILRAKLRKELALYRNTKGTGYAVSPNSKYFTFVSYVIYQKTAYYITTVYDSETLALIYEKTATRDEYNYFFHPCVTIDDEKNVYSYGKSFYNPDSDNIYTFSSIYIDIYVIDKFNSNDYKTLRLDFDNQYAGVFKSICLDDTLTIFGFYSISNRDLTKGLYAISVDVKTMKLIQKHRIDFPIEVFNDIYGNNKGREKQNKELVTFQMDHLFIDSENNTYVVAEQRYRKYGVYVGGAYSGSYPKSDIFGHILILKVNKEAELIWGRSIYKRAYKASSSYNAFLKEEKLHILLNTGKNIKTLKDGRNKLQKDLWEARALYNISFTENGEKYIQKIQNNGKNTFYLPYLGKYKNDYFIMPSKPKRKNRLMILK